MTKFQPTTVSRISLPLGEAAATPIAIICPLFPLGELRVTPGALSLFQGQPDLLRDTIRRHAEGDWGDLSAADKRYNKAAIKKGERVLSAYQVTETDRVWIITEADRSVTTVLLPDEH